MKIATFNINNINLRLENLIQWLGEAKPDIVCLQGLKAEQSSFPAAALQHAGYGSVWKGEKTWNGVAILAKGAPPVLIRTRLPGDATDLQARYMEAAVNGMLVASICLPQGNPRPGPKFEYKLAWLKRLHSHANSLLDTGIPVIMAGDYNVVPTPDDIYQTRLLDGNALIRPECRAAFAKLLSQGWMDSLRRIQPHGPLWTFWDYMGDCWPADRGMRLDHLLVSPQLAPRLVDAGVDRWVRDQEGASDHAPAWIDLAMPEPAESLDI